MQGEALVRRLTVAGAGVRRLDDPQFAREAPPSRLGVRHLDDELLCHDPAQTWSGRALACWVCGRMLASPHLLDLHVQEEHDSFFAAQAASRPSYCCYIEECKKKFSNPEERFDHCVQIHRLPKDFRFYQKPRIPKSKNNNESMDVDNKEGKNKPFTFSNSKVKAFVKIGKRTSLQSNVSNAMSVDEVDPASIPNDNSDFACTQK